MYPSEDVTGVEKSIRRGVVAISEPDTVKVTSFKAAFVIRIASEPMDPEELHALGLHMIRDPDVDMENRKDSGIPIRMPCCFSFFIFMSQHHDIQLGAYIDRVLSMPQVVCCVVDTKHLVFVNTIADECDLVSFFIRKCMLLSVVWDVIASRQQVILESWNEVLTVVSYAS